MSQASIVLLSARDLERLLRPAITIAALRDADPRSDYWLRGPGEVSARSDALRHSHHIDYGAKAATYVDTFMTAIRWGNADNLFAPYANSA